MKKKLLAATAVLGLIWFCTKPVYTVTVDEEEAIEPLRIVAPYESREHRQMLLDLTQRFQCSFPSIEIEAEFTPSEDYIKTLVGSYLVETPPDMMIVTGNNIGYLASEGLLQDITQEAKEMAEESAMHPLLAKEGTINGRRYGIPFVSTGYSIFVNETALNNLDTPIPKNWDGVETAARKILGTGPEGFAIAAREHEELVYQFLSLLFPAGGDITRLNSGESKAILDYLEAMGRDGTLSIQSINLNQRDLAAQFCNEEVIMMLNNSNQIPYIRNRNPDFKWTVADIPLVSGQRAYGKDLLVTENILFANGGRLKESLAFARFALNPQEQVDIALDYGGIPVNPELVSQCREDEAGIPEFFYEKAEHFQISGAYRLWPYISRSVRDGIYELLRQDKSAEQAAQWIQSQVRDKRLRNYSGPGRK